MKQPNSNVNPEYKPEEIRAAEAKDRPPPSSGTTGKMEVQLP
jgi:hypothetical protein